MILVQQYTHEYQNNTICNRNNRISYIQFQEPTNDDKFRSICRKLLCDGNLFMPTFAKASVDKTLMGV